MHKNATKCNKTLSKWCKNKHGASKIIDTFGTYQGPAHGASQTQTLCFPRCMGPLGHLQRADPFWCPKRSESVCLDRAADTKMRPVRLGGGQPNVPMHLLPTLPACKSRRWRHDARAKFQHVQLLPPEISRDAQANVSRRPFPRACQHFPSAVPTCPPAFPAGASSL
jgi:hypothetical protein